MKKLIEIALPLILAASLGINCGKSIDAKTRELMDARRVVGNLAALKEAEIDVNNNFSREFDEGAFFLILKEEPDSAIKYFNIDLMAIDKISKEEGRKGEDYFNIARAYSQKRDFRKSFENLELALAEFEKIKNIKLKKDCISDCYYASALNYKEAKDYANEISFLKKSASLKEEIMKDSKTINLDAMIDLEKIYKMIGDDMEFIKTSENRFDFYGMASELKDRINRMAPCIR